MSQAADKLITQDHPDAALLEMIAHVAELWAMAPRLEEQAVTSKRAGDLALAKDLERRENDICSKACDLEWTIAHTDAHTPEGHEAKVCAIVAADFDLDDLVEIAYRLGREAARLGLADDVPQLKPALAAAA